MFAQEGNDPFPEVPYSSWQGNMTVTSKVVLDGKTLTEGTIVAVYYNDQIRGKLQPTKKTIYI